MITAIDTNVLLDILLPNDSFYEASAEALQESAARGSLAVSDIVYAELCVYFEDRRECDAFLESCDIRVQALTPEAHFLASRAWRAYRRAGESGPESFPTFLLARMRSSRRRGCSREIEAFTGHYSLLLKCWTRGGGLGELSREQDLPGIKAVIRKPSPSRLTFRKFEK